MNLLKEFIMEQDLCDIKECQLIAEMNVLSSMIDCYVKQEMIMESCTDESVISEFSIFAEADTTDAESEDAKETYKKKFGVNDIKDFAKNKANDTKKIVKSKTSVVKRYWSKFIEFIKSIPGRIMSLFKKTSIKDLIDMAYACPDNTVFSMTNFELNSFTLLADIVDIFTPLIKGIMEGRMNPNDQAKYNELLNSFEKRVTVSKGGISPDGDDSQARPITKAKLIETLNNLRNNDDIPKSIKNLDKICKARLNSGEITEEGMKRFEESRGFINHCITLYNDSIKGVISAQKKIIKTASNKAST